MIALSVGGITLLAGCGGPTPDFEGPARVRVINDDGRPHTAAVTIETDGEVVFDRRIGAEAGSDSTLDGRIPGRKLLGRRTYTVTAELESGASATRSFVYDGMQEFLVVIEEGGSVTLSTYEPA